MKKKKKKSNSRITQTAATFNPTGNNPKQHNPNLTQTKLNSKNSDQMAKSRI